MKHLLATAAALLCWSTATWAQLPNSGFEQTDTSGKIAHWGKEYTFSGWMDPSGQFHTDSIVVDNAFYFSATSAHSGSRALELRNGYNYTAQAGIAGAAHFSTLPYQYSPFQNKLPLAAGRPTVLQFYHQFVPAGADTAWASVVLTDSAGAEIATGEAFLYQASPGYSLVTVPIVYTDSNQAAFIGVAFSTCKPAGVPTFGTRLLVDDVVLLPPITPAPSGPTPPPGPAPGPTATATPAGRLWRCYPTVVADRLFIEFPAALSGQLVDWHAVSSDGSTAAGAFLSTGGTHSLSLAHLPPGLYTVSFHNPAGAAFTTRVVKL